MKPYYLLILILCSYQVYAHKIINPVLGDKSFFTLFSHTPTEETNEDFRISVHLYYVEKVLRDKSTDHLDAEKQQMREETLDLLHQYLIQGKFPKNYDYPNERKPCFIDKEGNLCAVGYLVAQTAGIEVAEMINQKYQYCDLYDMTEYLTLIKNWAEERGLTLEECAMIQPTYGGVKWNAHYISASPLLSIRPEGQKYWGVQLMYNHTYINEVTGVMVKGNKNRTLSLGGHFVYHNERSYAGGFRLVRSIFIGKLLYPHLGFNTDIFHEDGENGLNLKPEVGFTFFMLFDWLGFKTTFTYGYNFAATKKHLYQPRRHELTFDIGFLIALSNDYRDDRW